MRILSFTSVMFILILFSACPYESDISICDETNSEQEEMILNTRYTGKTPDNIHTEVFFRPITDKSRGFFVEMLRYEKSGEIFDIYTGYCTQIAGKKIMQLERDKKFYFIKYKLAGYTLHWSYLNDNFVKNNWKGESRPGGTTSEELKKFITDNINHDSLFIGQASFVKFEPTPQGALQYYIVFYNENTNILKSFADVYAQNTGSKMREALFLLQEQIKESIKKISLLQRYDGDKVLKEKVLKIFFRYQSLSENELAELIDIMKNGHGTQEDIKKKEELEKIIQQKSSECKEEFNKISDAFVKKYNFTIPSNQQK